MAIQHKNKYEANYKDQTDFQCVPNVLIATDNDDGFASLKKKLKTVLDPGKVYRVILFNY